MPSVLFSPSFGNCIALNLAGAPTDSQWIMLVPAGNINGADGRVFINDAPEAVVREFAKFGRSAPVDINHSQFIKAPNGEPSPAVGWIEELQVREGAIWGRIEWNAAGKAALENRSYRYISPALRQDGAGRVIAILGAGVVNRPNFQMPALAAEQPLTAAPLKIEHRDGLSTFVPSRN
jgi:phage I-like protein